MLAPCSLVRRLGSIVADISGAGEGLTGILESNVGSHHTVAPPSMPKGLDKDGGRVQDDGEKRVPGKVVGGSGLLRRVGRWQRENGTAGRGERRLTSGPHCQLTPSPYPPLLRRCQRTQAIRQSHSHSCRPQRGDRS